MRSYSTGSYVKCGRSLAAYLITAQRWVGAAHLNLRLALRLESVDLQLKQM
jgi:hypothetical protein